MIPDDAETVTARKDDLARERHLRAIAEATLVGVQGSLVAVSTRNRALEGERDRLIREIAALARVIAEGGSTQLNGSDRVAGAVQQQDDTLRRLKAAEARARDARLAQAEAEGRYQTILKTTSWRITGPLRRVIRLLRRR